MFGIVGSTFCSVSMIVEGTVKVVGARNDSLWPGCVDHTNVPS